MAQHAVMFQVPRRPVGNTDVVFTVERDGERFGTLQISRGAVVWRPGKKWRGKGYRMGWAKLDELFRKRGRRGF